MIVTTEAKLIYGLKFSDVPEDMTNKVCKLLAEGMLDFASPYYAAPMHEWTVGVELHEGSFWPFELNTFMYEAHKKLSKIIEFPDEVERKFHLCKNVW